MRPANRRQIRPSFNNHYGNRKQLTSPEQTNAENFYYMKQMQSRTPMVIALKNGEKLHGIIEWYDKTCLKVNRNGAPNLLIYKQNIKYIYKASSPEEAGETTRRKIVEP